MGRPMKSFHELKIWQQGIDIVKDVCRISSNFPRTETYGLVSQMRRSAISIPSNIAEGFKRKSEKDYKRFLFMALGSAAELETQLIISNELQIADRSSISKIIEKLDTLSKMTYSLMSKFNI
jgi:four helix bundle protein